ncbi:MAG: endolytic transglycosylase MltG [Bacteroidales bacterium]|nr:endolytic transglycosylase MltG [Bacteroidales bacterium]
MSKKIIIILCSLAAAGLILVGAAYFTIFAKNTKNSENVLLKIPRQASYEQVLDSLRSHDILRNESTFKMVVKAMRFKTMRVGKYEIEPSMSNYKLVRLLRAGQHYPIKFSFNNTRTLDQFVEKVGHQFFFEPEELSALLHDRDFLAKHHLTEETVPSIFIPNSYEIYYDITAEAFFEKMYEQYQQFWNSERTQLAKEIGLTPTEVSTLASIVEEENFRPSEKAIIAGLYINRLQKGMLLQSDPTVKFAIGDFARKRILNADLAIDSPYNTYKYKGLPPGPIRIPEASTLDSVLHYRHHNYLFMCAKEDLSGYHNFTASAAEHAQNAARYRATLNKQHIKR